ncbi:MAG: hypothetical protein QM610_12710 [Chitinophagaceae bacterium]
MKKLFIAALVAMGVIVQSGCKKNTKDMQVVYEPTITDTSYAVKEIAVTIPDGSTYTATGADMYSFQYVSKVGSNGKVKVATRKGALATIYLLDASDNPVMAGFLTDSTTEVSSATTAKVLMYWAHGLPSQPYWAKKAFVNSVDNLAEMQAWVADYEELFKKDPLVFSNGGYLDKLKEHLLKMQPSTPDGSGYTGNRSKGTLMSKTPDITVLGSTEQRSGLQTADMEGGKVFVNNYYRRRAHAFLYKMDFTDMSGNTVEVKDAVKTDTAADNDFAVSPASGATSVMGIIGSQLEEYVSGEPTVIETFVKKNESPALLLNDDEQTSNYKARVVGPGLLAVTDITTAEKEKLYDLQIETFVFDCVLPAFALAGSNVEETMPDHKTAQDREAQIALIKSALNSMPDLNEAVKKSDFKGALRILRDNYAKDILSFAQSKLGEVVLKGYYWDGLDIKFEANYAKKFNKILSAFDLVLGASDMVRTGLNLSTSKEMEEWDLLLKAGTVTLSFVSGYDSLINTSEETKIQVEIKNMSESGDTHPYYEWSSTGKYGKLVDTKGNSGTSFETADNIVTYQSTVNSGDLADGDNIDYVYVKASYNNAVIGYDTIAVNVKKVDYEMKPADGTVTGKQHANAANTVTLYLAKTVTGLRDIPNNENLDFKVEWSTSGTYGNLVGETTTYNDDDIVYKATNDAVGVYYESVTARVYAKNKGETDYWLYTNVKGKVKIDNEQKKKLLYVPATELHGDSTYAWNYGGIRGWGTLGFCYRATGVVFAEDPDADRYELVFDWTTNIIGAPKSHAWKAGAVSPYPPHTVTGVPGHGNNSYSLVYSYGTRNYDADKETAHVNGGLSAAGAWVTIYLK